MFWDIAHGMAKRTSRRGLFMGTVPGNLRTGEIQRMGIDGLCVFWGVFRNAK